MKRRAAQGQMGSAVGEKTSDQISYQTKLFQLTYSV